MNIKSNRYTLTCRSAALPHSKHERRRMPAPMRSSCIYILYLLPSRRQTLAVSYIIAAQLPPSQCIATYSRLGAVFVKNVLCCCGDDDDGRWLFYVSSCTAISYSICRDRTYWAYTGRWSRVWLPSLLCTLGKYVTAEFSGTVGPRCFHCLFRWTG